MLNICKRTYTMDKTRSSRPVDVAHSLIPITKNQNRETKNLLFHKNLSGHILISLNSNNEPINAWRDMDGIVPIKSTFISDPEKFKHIVKSLKPHTIYLNDGELLQPLASECKLHVYSGKILTQILREIKISPQNNTNANHDRIPSFNDMKIMDPNITKQEYKKFRKNLLKSH